MRHYLYKGTRVFTVFVFILIFLQAGIYGEFNYKNKTKWKKYKTPEEAGFSSNKLLDARAYWESLRPAFAAVMIIYKGKILVSWGDTNSPYMCHSIRKSLLSALYGIHVKEGHINLQKTMADLGIDDVPPLTDAEKQAKVVHLLKSRSGIYHEAAYESPEMKAIRPPRGSHPPDTYWYYNNWDFNTLGTIFEQETGTKIFEEFKSRIADPLGMQDFKLDLCEYYYEWNLSIHPAYLFQMSARDRARFGLLYLQNGQWGDKQIVSKKWIRKSTRSYSDLSVMAEEFKGFGYGYMWYVLSDEIPVLQSYNYLKDIGPGFYASGSGGHVIMILPEQEIVFVQVIDTFQGYDVDNDKSFSLFDKILAAKETDIFDLTLAKTWFRPKKISEGENVKLNARVKNLSRKISIPTGVDFYLSKNNKFNKRDIHIGYAELAAIKYNKKKTTRLNTQILSKIKPGRYYIITCVDRDNLNLDPYPENNIYISSKKLLIK